MARERRWRGGWERGSRYIIRRGGRGRRRGRGRKKEDGLFLRPDEGGRGASGGFSFLSPPPLLAPSSFVKTI